MGNSTNDDARELVATGIHSQPYNDITNPKYRWPVSKYFLRRWVPYLDARRFWLIIAMRQLAYQHDTENRRDFTVYDASILESTTLGRAAFYRLKAEMGSLDKETENKAAPLSLFVGKTVHKHEYINGQTRPGKTSYWVRLDDVLTPGDATHLRVWLTQEGGRIKTKTELQSLLSHTLKLVEDNDSPTTHCEILAPSQTPYINDPTRQYLPITVFDVVANLYPNLAQDAQVRDLCQKITSELTSHDHYSTHYFRERWLPTLGVGPALLFVYLSSYTFFSKKEGVESRDRAEKVKLADLTDLLGVDVRTIRRWLKTLTKPIPPEKNPVPQPYPYFLQEVIKERRRDETGELLFTYRATLYDPVHPDDIPLYAQKMAGWEPIGQNETHDIEGDGREEGATGQNETHGGDSENQPIGQNETHTETAVNTPIGQNETHAQAEIGAIQPPIGQNETHAGAENGTAVAAIGSNETHAGGNRIKENSRGGAIGQKETANRTKRDSIYNKYLYKYYSCLIDLLNIDESCLTNQNQTTTTNDGWKLNNEQALLSFAQAAVGSKAGFCDHLEITGVGYKDIINSTLCVEELVAWYLYCQTQKKFTSHDPLTNRGYIAGYIINRARKNELPPAAYTDLTFLSWELWRCYMAAYVFATRLDRADADMTWPSYTEWQQYASRALQCGADELPFGISNGLYELHTQTAKAEHESNAAHAQTLAPAPLQESQNTIWKEILNQLKLTMSQGTFNAWLKGSMLISRDDGQYVVAVHNSYAVDWLTNRLKNRIMEIISHFDAQAKDIMFVVQEQEYA